MQKTKKRNIFDDNSENNQNLLLISKYKEILHFDHMLEGTKHKKNNSNPHKKNLIF
jgi:hypothetical protein